MSIEQVERPDYMPSLDGLRGLACLLVVASHISDLLNLNFDKHHFYLGWSGVLIFFSLSGFLMGSLYFSKSFDVKNASDYVVSRFSRIMPCYYLAIVFCLVASIFIDDFKYAMDFVTAVRAFAFGSGVGVFWSIPPEIQFYVFFMLLWLAYHRWKAEKPALMIFVILLSFIFLATGDQWGGLTLPSKYHIFISGFLGAVIIQSQAVQKICCNVYFQTASVITFLLYLALFINMDNFYSSIPLAIIVGIMVMSLSRSTDLTKVLEYDFIRLVGAASFSIYLFHEPIMIVVNHFMNFFTESYINIAISVIISLCAPIMLHFALEKRLNKYTKVRANDFFNRATTYYNTRAFKAS